MTVSSIVPVNNYTGNSSTKIFDFDFLIENEKELVVQYQDKNGIVSILQYGVDYSINEIGNKNGSYIEFPLNDSHYGILQPDEQISLALSLQIKQESEFHNSSYFNLGVLEWTFDYIIRILQILNRKIDRCVKVEESISISPDEIINEINDKYEKVNSTYLQIVEVSKDVEENKNISIQQTNATFENAEIAKNQADLAIQKAKEAGLIVGEKIAIFSSNEYVPECCLPCDGATYEREQFEDLCKNYLDKSSSLLNTCTMEEYEAEVATYGQCGKFGVDGLNTVVTDLGNTKANIDTNGVAFSSLYPNGVTLEFIYDGSNWTLEGKAVNLSDYYITQTGTAEIGEFFRVSYGSAKRFKVPLIKDTETVVTNNIDYDNGITISASPTADVPFTAPCDGVYMTTLTKSNTNGYLYVNGVHTPFYRGDATGGESWDNFFVPLSKGDVIYWEVTLTPKTSHFYPYKEETKEKLKSFVVVANGQTNQSMMDWSAWASSLQGKANADLSNCTKPYVVEVSDKSLLPSWYRVWSDGWCEQGSYLETSATGKVTINLLKDFVNTNYGIQLTESHTATITDARTVNNADKTTSSFQIFRGTTAIPIYWEAKGYIR